MKLEIKDLHAVVIDTETGKEKEILKGLNLSINTGEMHAIMGPNGVGKSTLSNVLLGNSHYSVSFRVEERDLKLVVNRQHVGSLEFQSC